MNFTSSANMEHLHVLILSENSFMKAKKRIGPRTEPWGTLDVGSQEEGPETKKSAWFYTRCFVFSRYELNPFNSLPSKP